MHTKKISKLFLLIFLVLNSNFNNCQAKLTKKEKIQLGALAGTAAIGGGLTYGYFKIKKRKLNGRLIIECKYFDNPKDIENIVKNGANINTKTLLDETPLHIILSESNNISDKDRTSLVKFFLKNGANINAQDDLYRTPIQIELSRTIPNLTIIRTLIKNNADISKYELNSLVSLDNLNIKTVRLLLENGADINQINSNGKSILYRELSKENLNVELIKFLVTNGAIAKKNWSKFNPLKIFFNKKINNNPNKRLELLKFFIEEKKENINSRNNKGETPLLQEISRNNSSLEIVKLLIENGADINAISDTEETPLNLGLDKKSPDIKIIKLLIENGANIKLGRPILLSLIKKNINNINFKLLKYLIKNGADINTIGYFSDKLLFNGTLLHKFVSQEQLNLDIIKYLLKINADVNIKDRFGRTPLYILLSKINPNIGLTRLLIENGADINIRSNGGMRPISLIRDNNLKSYIQNLYNEFNNSKNSLSLDLLNSLNNKSFFDDSIDLESSKNNISCLITDDIIKIFNPLTPEIREKELVEIIEEIFKSNKSAEKTLDEINRKLKLNINTESLNIIGKFLEEKKKNSSNPNIIQIHKVFLEKRLGKEIEEIKNILKDIPASSINSLLEWVYTGHFPEDDELRTSIVETLTLFDIDISKKTTRKGLSEDLKDLQKDEKSKDFSIIVKDKDKDKEIKVHKFILAARSKLYRDMFACCSNENITQVKDFSEKSYETIKTWVDFLYTDKIDTDNLDKKVLDELSDAVDYYQMNKNSMLNFYLYPSIEHESAANLNKTQNHPAYV